MKRNWVTKAGIVLGIIAASFMAADGLSWIEERGRCHGQCGHNDRDCQQVCLDKGYCPADVRCRCKVGEGISVVVSDQGQGFDPSAVPDPLSVDNLEAEHGRGIHLMKLAMDEVSFEQRGTEVHMFKGRLRASNHLV